MKRSTMIEVMVLLVISLGFSGCIGFQPFPLAARSGDTISLALGGSPSHEIVPGSQITLDDLNITIQQDINGNGVIDADEKFPVKKRYLFRLYPDLTSNVANFSVYGDTPVGEWSAVLDLVDPSTNAPLPLVGNRQAAVVVATSKLKNNKWSTAEGKLTSIPLTILPGTGQSNNFNNNAALGVDIASLQPLPQLALSFLGTTNVAAIDLDIDYDENILWDESYFKIRPNVSTPNIVVNQRVYFDDNGIAKIRIMLMTNQGVVPANNMKCFVVMDPAYIDYGSVTDSTFTVTSAKFYNESGVEVTGVSVVKTLLYQ